MTFKHYLEEEDDKPYFTTNSLGYYYDKMEGFAEKVEQAAKILNVTKEEVEKNITAYIEQNKNELDQRLTQWDGKLETFDSSVETLLTEWVDDGTLTHVIDSTLIDQRLAPLTSQLIEKVGGQVKAKMEDLDNEVISAITGGATVNVLSEPQNDSVTDQKVPVDSLSINRTHGMDLILNDLKYQNLPRTSFNIVDKKEMFTQDINKYVFFTHATDRTYYKRSYITFSKIKTSKIIDKMGVIIRSDNQLATGFSGEVIIKVFLNKTLIKTQIVSNSELQSHTGDTSLKVKESDMYHFLLDYPLALKINDILTVGWEHTGAEAMSMPYGPNGTDGTFEFSGNPQFLASDETGYIANMKYAIDVPKITRTFYVPFFAYREILTKVTELVQPPTNETTLVIIDDDGRDRTHELWKPIIEEKGVPITIAPTLYQKFDPTWNQATQTFIGVQQMLELQDLGVEFVNHGNKGMFTSSVYNDYNLIKQEFVDSVKWHKDNGLNRYNDSAYYYVYPGGLTGTTEEIATYKEFISKYFKVGVNAGQQTIVDPNQPFDRYNIPRVTGDSKTASFLNLKLDEAIAVNGMMIVLSHSYTVDTFDAGDPTNFNARYKGLIDYALANGVKVRTLTDALKVRGLVK